MTDDLNLVLLTDTELLLIKQALEWESNERKDYRAQVAFSRGVLRGGRKDRDGKDR